MARIMMFESFINEGKLKFKKNSFDMIDSEGEMPKIKRPIDVDVTYKYTEEDEALTTVEYFMMDLTDDDKQPISITGEVTDADTHLSITMSNGDVLKINGNYDDESFVEFVFKNGKTKKYSYEGSQELDDMLYSYMDGDLSDDVSSDPEGDFVKFDARNPLHKDYEDVIQEAADIMGEPIENMWWFYDQADEAGMSTEDSLKNIFKEITGKEDMIFDKVINVGDAKLVVLQPSEYVFVANKDLRKNED